MYNGGINPSGYTNIYNRENAITISEGNSAGFVNFVQEKFFSGGHNYTIVNNVTDTLFLFLFVFYSRRNNAFESRNWFTKHSETNFNESRNSKTTDNEQKFIGLFLKI